MFNKLKISLLGIATLLTFGGCDQESINQFLQLTNADKTKGLKSLLSVCTDTSVSQTSRVNGYFGDNLIKIPWPQDAQIILTTLNDFGLSSLTNDFVLRLNRSAESAAKTATPIFIDAIVGISFTDATTIITGTDTAATQYLRTNTYTPLKSAFAPKIDSVLQLPLVAGTSAASSWNSITTQYNSIRTNPVNILLNLPPVNTNLSDYVTTKALNGLFVKLAGHEARVRNSPALQVTEDIRKIFKK
jgi:hypothetical protein